MTTYPFPPGVVAYLCPRCRVQAEVVEQSDTVTELRCPQCQQTLSTAVKLNDGRR